MHDKDEVRKSARRGATKITTINLILLTGYELKYKLQIKCSVHRAID